MKAVLPPYPSPQIKDRCSGEGEQCLQPSRKKGKREYGKNKGVSKREMGKEGMSSAGERRNGMIRMFGVGWSWSSGDNPALGMKG